VLSPTSPDIQPYHRYASALQCLAASAPCAAVHHGSEAHYSRAAQSLVEACLPAPCHGITPSSKRRTFRSAQLQSRVRHSRRQATSATQSHHSRSCLCAVSVTPVPRSRGGADLGINRPDLKALTSPRGLDDGGGAAYPPLIPTSSIPAPAPAPSFRALATLRHGPTPRIPSARLHRYRCMPQALVTISPRLCAGPAERSRSPILGYPPRAPCAYDLRVGATHSDGCAPMAVLCSTRLASRIRGRARGVADPLGPRRGRQHMATGLRPAPWWMASWSGDALPAETSPIHTSNSRHSVYRLPACAVAASPTWP